MKKDKISNRDKKVKIIIALLVIILVLIIIRIGISSYNSSKVSNEVDDEETEELLTFDDVIDDWGVLYQENKSYEIENVKIGDIKGTLSIEYKYSAGVKSLIIKHDNSVLVSDERNSDDGDFVLTYLDVYNDEYLIWGEQYCDAYKDDNNICLPSDVISLHVVNYEMNEVIEKIDGYYIYDVNTTDDVIELKMLLNEYGSGMWSCDSSTGDIQRVYSVIIDKNKITTNKVSSITFSEYCANDESIVIDWE